MATIRKRKSTDSFRVKYKHPETLTWKTEYHKNKDEAEVAKAKYDYIEMCLKTGSLDWKRVYYGYETKTVQECFDFYQEQVLDDKLNRLTEARYHTSMHSFLKVFPGETRVAEIRAMKRKIYGREKTGIAIWKASFPDHSRRTINSNIRDCRRIFEYCRQEDFIKDEVIRKNDKYANDALPALDKKVWKQQELYMLDNHPGISEFDREVIQIYYMTGCRAKELVGFNYLNRDKELYWHHVDFSDNTIMVLRKRGKVRTEVVACDEVMAILKKWQDRGDERPLNFGYDIIRDVIARVSLATGIKFTCHDLRRLNGQLVRPELGLQGAATSLGNSSLEVVDKHYAGMTREEKLEATNAMLITRRAWLEAGDA